MAVGSLAGRDGPGGLARSARSARGDSPGLCETVRVSEHLHRSAGRAGRPGQAGRPRRPSPTPRGSRRSAELDEAGAGRGRGVGCRPGRGCRRRRRCGRREYTGQSALPPADQWTSLRSVHWGATDRDIRDQLAADCHRPRENLQEVTNAYSGASGKPAAGVRPRCGLLRYASAWAMACSCCPELANWPLAAARPDRRCGGSGSYAAAASSQVPSLFFAGKANW